MRLYYDVYLNRLKSVISDMSGLNYVKFVPNERNIMIQLFNNSLKTFISESDETPDFLLDLNNGIFSAYFKWLYKRRSSIENMDKYIKDIFKFIMHGTIESDKNSNELIYKSHNSSVSINLASSMVKEIAGIMLPVPVI